MLRAGPTGLSLAMLGIVAAGAGAERPRTALIYSDYGGFRHRDDYDARLADMGWSLTKFENTQFGDLVGRLDSLDLILGSALFNYSRVQDFSAYRDELLAFVRAGGGIILTDCNYPAHLSWLAGMGEGWAVTCRNTEQTATPMSWLEAEHPIFTTPNRISSLGDCWAHMDVGEAWTPLARSAEGGVTAAMREEGRGYLLLTSKWPHHEQMLENLWTYLRFRRAGVVASLPDLQSVSVGRNRLTARIANLTDTRQEAALEVRDEVAAQDPVIVRATVDLPPEGTAQARLVLEIEERGEHTLTARVLVDGTQAMELRPVSVFIPPLLSTEVLRPRYRQSIYQASPPSEIRLRLNVLPDPGVQLDELHAHVRLDVEKAEPVRVAHVARGGTDAVVPLPQAPEREVTAIVELYRGEEVLTTERIAIPVVPPRAEQVFLDDAGVAVSDGQPFFPVGIYHVGLDDFGRLPEMEFNTVVAWGSTLDGAREGLDAAHRAGLKVVLEMSRFLRGELDLPGLGEVVRGVQEHPALLAWYSVDEPSAQQIQWCEAAYDLIARTEPHHPVYLVMCNPAAFGEFASTTDILAVDPYPIPHTSIDMVAGWVKRAQQAVGPGQSVWVIPQCHNWSAYRAPGTGRGPTAQEERCMVYQGVIYGAKGVIYYPWDDGPTGLAHDPKLMEAVKQINAELGVLGRDLLTSERHLIADNEPPGLRAASFVGRQRSYIIATNTGAEPIEAELPLPGLLDAEVQVVFEGRGISSGEGLIRDTLEPLAVHVYRITQR